MPAELTAILQSHPATNCRIAGIDDMLDDEKVDGTSYLIIFYTA